MYTYDAPWHRGRDVTDPYPISTERFVADLGDAVGSLGAPVRLVAHSMGALHSWCLAAERPDLISALVLEDMAPDFRGRTTGPWEPWLYSIPVEFHSAKDDSISSAISPGSISWMPSTALPPAGGCTVTRQNGSRSQPNGASVTTGTNGWEWAPSLFIEAGISVAPPGQILEMTKTDCPTTYLHVPESGHLVHDEAPQIYRQAVESFLRPELAGPAVRARGLTGRCRFPGRICRRGRAAGSGQLLAVTGQAGEQVRSMPDGFGSAPAGCCRRKRNDPPPLRLPPTTSSYRAGRRRPLDRVFRCSRLPSGSPVPPVPPSPPSPAAPPAP